MAGGSKIKIKGGVASKGEALVVDGALLVTDVGAGAGGAVRFLQNFSGQDSGSGVISVNVMGAASATRELGIPIVGAHQTRNVAVRIRRDAAAAPGSWTLRLFRNDIEVATFTVATT